MDKDNKEYNHDLQKAIDYPIAFFDLFNFPLTAWEIWKYLPIKMNFEDIYNHLSKNYYNKQGFFLLPERKEIIEVRKKRYNYTDVKFKKALRIIKIFKFIPWIKGVAIGNIIGAHNLKDEGDIDFLIITNRDRIWISRFICVAIIKLLGLRPSPAKSKNTICLSFFISEEHLNLKNLMLVGKKDVYFIHWLAGLTPVYGSDDFWNDFIKANNWLYDYLPNWKFSGLSYKRRVKSIKSINLFQGCGSLLNKICKFIQLKILPQNLRSMMNKDTRVIINDQVLKMHFNDRRAEYNNNFFDSISNKNKIKK